MNEPREKDDRREPLEGRVMTDETGNRMRGVRGEPCGKMDKGTEPALVAHYRHWWRSV